MLDPDPIAARMRAERKRRGWSLRQMATETGIPDIVIGSWERGDRNPALPQVRRWLRSLGFDLAVVPAGDRVAAGSGEGSADGPTPDGRPAATHNETGGSDAR